MEFRELKTFQVVANLLSFNNAASVLHMAQSTVSAQIKSLENSLGKELFERKGKKISLTQAGLKLLDYSQRLVNLEKEIESVLGNLDDKYGSLFIKTPQSISTYFFPDFIREFKMIFPKIGFDVDWCTSFNLIDIINSGTIDLAFLITNDFEDKRLIVEELTEIKLVLAIHPNDELLRNKTLSIKDLNAKTLILAKSECNYRNMLQKKLIENSVRLKRTIEINSLDAVKRLLLLGDGIAFIPEMIIAEELKKGLLKTLAISGVNFDAKIVMIWSKEKHISESMNAFMIMVRALMKEYEF